MFRNRLFLILCFMKPKVCLISPCISLLWLNHELITKRNFIAVNAFAESKLRDYFMVISTHVSIMANR